MNIAYHDIEFLSIKLIKKACVAHAFELKEMRILKNNINKNKIYSDQISLYVFVFHLENLIIPIMK